LSVENFSWVIPQKIAGCAVPDFADWDDNAAWLAERGVNVLISLVMPYGPADKMCAQAGIEWVHYPIEDFKTPTNMHTFTSLIDQIVEYMKNDRGVCVHCHAGIGRTGLVLSCAVGKYLSLSSEMAKSTVRQMRVAIETAAQEEFIRKFLDG
jgi:atypical dual specificity phosphatase